MIKNNMRSKTNSLKTKILNRGVSSLLLLGLCLPTFAQSNTHVNSHPDAQSNTHTDYTALGKKVGKGVWHTAQAGAGVVAVMGSVGYGGIDPITGVAFGISAGALLATSFDGFKQLLGKESATPVVASIKQRAMRGLWAAVQLSCCGRLGYKIIQGKYKPDTLGSKIFVTCLMVTLLSNSIGEFKDILYIK